MKIDTIIYLERYEKMIKSLTSYQHIHCIGIGGSGVSALVRLLRAYKLNVSGSDQKESAITLELKTEGCKLHIGHQADNLSATVDLVIYSPSIPENNPEKIEATKRGIPTLSYPEAVGVLTKEKETISICGTHGKTTTTAMVAAAFIAAKKDPAVIVGSTIRELNNSNYRGGNGSHFILESCEYRRGFLNYSPKTIAITNIEPDHLDYYRDAEDYQTAFAQFVERLPAEGFVIGNFDDPTVQKICKKSNKKVISIGKKVTSDYSLSGNDVLRKRKKIATLDLKVPGEHNRMNALMALALSSEQNLDIEKVCEALNQYQGAQRRFEIKGSIGKTTIIDDYGHHPTEIKTTLKAVREKYGSDKKVACIFQPHQYNRTYKLLQSFALAFKDADSVIIPNIFQVRDKKVDLENMNEEKLVAEISKHHKNVHWGRGLVQTATDFRDAIGQYDIVITMGAGDVWQIADALVSGRV